MIQFSTQKPNEAPEANEDRYRIDAGLFAISDGAGGEGLAADLWAETILEQLPKEPITNVNDVNDWIGSFCDAFEKDINTKIQANPTAIERFLLQGSLATLVAVWKNDKQLDYVAIGDSMLLLYDSRNKTIWTPFGDEPMLCFNDNPHLISLRENTPVEQIKLASKTYNTDDVLVLATDAFAKLLLVLYYYTNDKPNYENQKGAITNPNYSDYLAKFENYMQQNTDFTFDFLLENLQNKDQETLQEFVYSLYASEILSYDDYTFLIHTL